MVKENVRINIGASIMQDMAFGRWPATRDGKEVDPDMVFEAEWVANRGYWDCMADGFGRRKWLGEAGGYGNGSIFVLGEDSVTVVKNGCAERRGMNEQILRG